jgi:hypothetical protein
MKKSLVMFAALLAVSAAPIERFYSASAATVTSVGNFNGTLNNAPLVAADVELPKCYPYCGG